MNKQRIKTNLIKTAANVTYYGGTIGAGLAFYNLLNNHSPIAIAALVVFIVTVEGLLRILLDEVLDATTQKDSGATAATAPANTKGGAR